MNETDKARLTEIKEDVLNGKDIKKCDVVFLLQVVMFLQIENKILNESDAFKEKSSMHYYNLYKELEDKIKEKLEEYKNKKS